MSYVYLARPKDTEGVYKIGTTINPEKRIERYNKQKAFDIEYIHIVPVHEDYGMSTEQELHRIYSDYRLCSEWFVLPIGVLDRFPYIVKLTESTVIEKSRLTKEAKMRYEEWLESGGNELSTE